MRDESTSIGLEILSSHLSGLVVHPQFQHNAGGDGGSLEDIA